MIGNSPSNPLQNDTWYSEFLRPRPAETKQGLSSQATLSLREEIAHILQHGRLQSWLQPIVDMHAAQVYGFEALVRGPADSSLQTPNRLFASAQATNMETELELNCRHLHIQKFAQAKLPGKLFLNVNPNSLLELDHPQGFTRECVERYGLKPEQVVIELTEEYPIYKPHLVQEALQHYRSMGFSIALDDLGTAYSGLSCLWQLQPEYVKFDKQFIIGIGQDRQKSQFLESLLDMARRMGCYAIAEGVETLSQIITEHASMSQLGNDFIITQQSEYWGLGTVMDLLRKMTELQVRNARYANPLTGLPGNVPINERIEQLLQQRQPFALCYCDLDNFKPFNDIYGYQRGDTVIQTLGNLLTTTVASENSFIGHIGGDDFVVIAHPDHWEALCRQLLEAFANEIPKLYDARHRQLGGFYAEDRQRREIFYPLMSLSIGVVIPQTEHIVSHHEVSAAAAEAKKMAKEKPGNSYFAERRQTRGAT